jgi:hypothetical protein
MSLFGLKNHKNQGLPYLHQVNEAGGAIIWVFVMIGLFGALSFAVNQGSRGGAASLSEKQAELAASEILDYARNIKNAVRMLQINGCDDTEVSFDQAFVSGYSNPNSPTDESCHVFSNNGGGLRYQSPNNDWLDTNFNIPANAGNYGVWWFSSSAQIDGVGTSEAELKVSLNFLKENICLKLNDTLSISNPSGSVPLDESDDGIGKFTGTYGAPVADNIGDDGGHDLSGKLAFCRREGTPIYQFNQVLIAR